jgi:hypothetical protein
VCSPTLPFHLLLQYACLYLLAYRIVRKIGFNNIASSAGNTTSRGLLKAVQSTCPVLFGTPKKLPLLATLPQSRRRKRSTPPSTPQNATEQHFNSIQDNDEGLPGFSPIPAWKKPRFTATRSIASSPATTTSTMTDQVRTTSSNTIDITSDAPEPDNTQESIPAGDESSTSRESPLKSSCISRPSRKALGCS